MTCSPNVWLALPLALTALPPQRPSVSSASNWTAPKSAAGRCRTAWPIPPRSKSREPPFDAGSAPRSANSGNWTLPLTFGSLPAPRTSPCSTCSTTAAGSSSAQIYDRETLLAYFDFLPTAFLAYGRPLQLYVDYHSIFFTKTPEALTQLGWALRFYDISFLYAPTPQAKGKVEREHQFWQGRLPPYFASEQISDPETANPHVDALRLHHNSHEIHRELKQTPQKAWNTALKEKRSILRPSPRCPWWPYVWSLRTIIKVGSDGRVPIGPQRLRVERPPGSKVVLCLHPSGHHSVLLAPPQQNAKPEILFTNRQK